MGTRRLCEQWFGMGVQWILGLAMIAYANGCAPKPSTTTTLPPQDEPRVSITIRSTQSITADLGSTRSISTSSGQTNSGSSSRTGSAGSSSSTGSSSPTGSATLARTGTAGSSSSTGSGSPASTVPSIPATRFQEGCVDEFNGVFDGARCFFNLDTISDWDGSWGACNARIPGSKLARIMSSREMEKIRRYLLDRLGPRTATDESGFIRIALRRNENALPIGRESLVANATFWYDEVETFDPKLSVQNTWIGSRSTVDDPYSPNQACIHLFSNFTNFADSDCIEKRMKPLCMVYDESGDTYRQIVNICMSRSPLEIFPAPNVQSCMNECKTRDWCRSFNFLNTGENNALALNNARCQFFPFIMQDNTFTTGNAQCQYYEYIEIGVV